MRKFLLVFSLAALFVLPILFPVSVNADGEKQKPAAKQPISDKSWIFLIRELERVAYAKKSFPGDDKGLTIKPGGEIKPNGPEFEGLVGQKGLAIKVGEKVNITDIMRKGNKIILQLNKGPQKKKKWYEHLDVCSVGGCDSPKVTDESPNPFGSLLTVEFSGYIPEMTPAELKQMIASALDFNAVSGTEAYLKAIPAVASKAIKEHMVLVGMDQEMVIQAKGLPPRKIREKDEDGSEYIEWIYGEPPKDVWFIRFVGEYVSRLEIMKINGEKTISTERVPDLDNWFHRQEEAAKAKAAAPQKPVTAPTLRRPGEEVGNTPPNLANPAPPCKEGQTRNCEQMPQQAPPGQQPAPGGPPQ